MSKCKDITNQKFGKLTAIHRLHGKHDKAAYWLCLCECGKFVEAKGINLRSSRVQSCGCLKHKPRCVTHGRSNSRIYRAWQHMKQRCYNSNYSGYKNWGGRGITICDEWLNDFQAFYDWSMNNGYKENLTIDRIDNNKCYSPDNCSWVDQKTQQNNRRNNICLTYNNKTQTISKWSEELNINKQTIYTRHKKGYTDYQCLFGK